MSNMFQSFDLKQDELHKKRDWRIAFTGLDFLLFDLRRKDYAVLTSVQCVENLPVSILVGGLCGRDIKEDFSKSAGKLAEFYKSGDAYFQLGKQ